MSLSVNIIGAGKLGKTLGKLLVSQQIAYIQGIVNRSIESAQSAVDFIGQGQAYAHIHELPAADLTLIATPDNLIQPCCEALATSKNLQVNSIVFHCSGSLQATELQAVSLQHCLIASVHPLRSFADPSVSVLQFPGTFCALEGDPHACATLAAVLEKIGGRIYTIQSEHKASYHAAGVFASNYLITLFNEALVCLNNAGIPHDLAKQLTHDLMSGTLNNLEKTHSTQDALTGPIKRGDLATIALNLAAISEPDRKKLYAELALATLKFSGLSDAKQQEIRQFLLPFTA